MKTVKLGKLTEVSKTMIDKLIKAKNAQIKTGWHAFTQAITHLLYAVMRIKVQVGASFTIIQNETYISLDTFMELKVIQLKKIKHAGTSSYGVRDIMERTLLF